MTKTNVANIAPVKKTGVAKAPGKNGNGEAKKDTFVLEPTDLEKVVSVIPGVMVKLWCRVCEKMYARAILAPGSEVEGVCPRCRQTTIWRAGPGGS